MKLFITIPILLFVLLSIYTTDVDAKKKGKGGGKGKKKKGGKYSTQISTMTRTAMTRTITNTVIQEMAAPTKYTKQGDCYCQIWMNKVK